LPPGAEWLAYSSECRNQAFRAGDLVYGLQFHLEAAPGMIAGWCAEYPEAAREIRTQIDPHAHAARVRELAGTVFGRWCRMVEEVREH
jgi:GMP synthase-like glutamine amidotransferase